MDRYTRKDADAAFRRLCKATGHEEGPIWQQIDGRNVATVGAWYLDYNPTYGGCVVYEVSNEGGGVREPFGSRRLSPRDFVQAVNFALRAMEYVPGFDPLAMFR